jgi:chromosome segregation ATPase
MHRDTAAPASDTVTLERRIADLEERLAGAGEQLAEARDRLDRLVDEQGRALEALQRAESRRGSLPYRLAAELRERLGGSR